MAGHGHEGLACADTPEPEHGPFLEPACCLQRSHFVPESITHRRSSGFLLTSDLLIWHALLVSTFFAFLWRSEVRERKILFAKAFLIMVVGAVLLGWLMLGERLDTRSMFVFIVAVCGAMVMLWDSAIGAPWPSGTADWLAVSSGFAFALSNVFVRKLHHVTVLLKSVSSFLGVVVVAAAWIDYGLLKKAGCILR